MWTATGSFCYFPVVYCLFCQSFCSDNTISTSKREWNVSKTIRVWVSSIKKKGYF